MLHYIEKVDSCLSRRIIQPQSDSEYADLARTFPDPQAPATHQVVYRWENGPTRNHSRRLVLDPQLHAMGALQPTAPQQPDQPSPKKPLNEARRAQLAAMNDADFATEWGVSGMGTLPKKMTRVEAIAKILEAEAGK